MQDVTKDLKALGATTQPGERFYLTDSGHYFRVFGIRDEVASQHGSEVLRLFATEVDLDGKDVLRSDGSPAQDHHGHTLVRMAHDVIREAVPEGQTGPDAEISFRQHVLAETKSYLERCTRASENHAELAEFDDMFVNSSKAHYLPPTLTHLEERNLQPHNSVPKYDPPHLKDKG